MSVDINRIRRRVREFDLRGLFIQELAWDYDRAKSFEAEGWTLRPQLPRHWRRLAFTYRANGQPVEVDIQRDEGGEYRVRHTNR